MNRIPIARLTRGEAVIVVYFDDYFDDYCEGLPNLPPYPPPEYTAIGDKFLKREFEDFAETIERPPSGHYPYPWSKASVLAGLFAKEAGCLREKIIPLEIRNEGAKEYDPHVRVY